MPASNKRYSLIVAETKEDADISLGYCTDETLGVQYSIVAENLLGNAAWTANALTADHVTMDWPLIEGYEEPLPAWYVIEYDLDDEDKIERAVLIWQAE